VTGSQMLIPTGSSARLKKQTKPRAATAFLKLLMKSLTKEPNTHLCDVKRVFPPYK